MVLRFLRRAASLLALVACFGLAACVLVPALAGYQRYVITSGSMSGSYDRGSLMYAREVPTSSLRVGDVITYRPPGPTGKQGLVTHRISWIGEDREGARAFRTRGDANQVADPWRFTLVRRTQARAVFQVPHVGYALAVLADRRARMVLIGLPALLIAAGVLARLWRQAGEELRHRQAAAINGSS
jgi:signal peptidase